MKCRTALRNLVVLTIIASGTVPARAQSIPGWGRFSLFAQSGEVRQDTGLSTSFRETSASFTLRSATADEGGFEYAFDLRSANYSGTDIPQRTSIYDAYVGARTNGGAVGFRLGQMWLNELGGLGSLGGGLIEIKQRNASAAGRLRFGLFGGLEPQYFTTGYVSGVTKGGAYLALDGEGARRHVIGYVQVRNQGLVERSVLTVSNFIPVGRSFFLYQAAEYDLAAPGGQGQGGLNYLFATMRVAPISAVELQATYHHGRSVDARTITNDQIAGRPVDPRQVEGLLFESIGGRLTFTLAEGVRLYGGYAQEKNNREDFTTGRTTVGFSASNILKSGVDLTVSDNRMDQAKNALGTSGGGHYDSWYASLGRNMGSHVYLSLDYSTSLRVVRITDQGGVTIENRPQSKRYGFSGLINVSRAFSLLLTGDQTKDDHSTDKRLLVGLIFRF